MKKNHILYYLYFTLTFSFQATASDNIFSSLSIYNPAVEQQVEKAKIEVLKNEFRARQIRKRLPKYMQYASSSTLDFLAQEARNIENTALNQFNYCEKKKS